MFVHIEYGKKLVIAGKLQTVKLSNCWRLITNESRDFDFFLYVGALKAFPIISRLRDSNKMTICYIFSRNKSSLFHQFGYVLRAFRISVRI